MELKVIIFIAFIVIAMVVIVIAKQVWFKAHKAQQELKLVGNNKIKVKPISVTNHADIFEKTALLLAQNEMLDLELEEIKEEELFKISMSFRMERRARIQQLKNIGVLDMELARKRLRNL